MIVTTTPHDDDDGLTVEVRGIGDLFPEQVATRIADAVSEAVRVLIIPPSPDGQP